MSDVYCRFFFKEIIGMFHFESDPCGFFPPKCFCSRKLNFPSKIFIHTLDLHMRFVKMFNVQLNSVNEFNGTFI